MCNDAKVIVSEAVDSAPSSKSHRDSTTFTLLVLQEVPCFDFGD